MLTFVLQFYLRCAWVLIEIPKFPSHALEMTHHHSLHPPALL